MMYFRALLRSLFGINTYRLLYTLSVDGHPQSIICTYRLNPKTHPCEFKNYIVNLNIPVEHSNRGSVS